LQTTENEDKIIVVTVALYVCDTQSLTLNNDINYECLKIKYSKKYLELRHMKRRIQDIA
jgi:hypothetical protein